MPIQGAWEYVNIGGKVRKLNLRDNKDGTWTYSRTGNVFHHIGKKHLGSRLLELAAGKKKAQAPKGFDPRQVLIKVGPKGKIQYIRNTPQDRSKQRGNFLAMDAKEFATFKSGGKRTPSQKVMDPASLARYHYDEGEKRFYHWDKSERGGRGKAVAKQLNRSLLLRLAKNQLVDRRRPDRTTEILRPFDVGSYRKITEVPQRVDKLSGLKPWTPKGRDVNRDHVPSGQSLNLRKGTGAYPEGITIALPNPEMHRTFSPTYGGKQRTKDQIVGKKRKRVEIDSEHPNLAVYRDISFMLDATRGQDYSSSHQMLDLSKSENRFRQLGSYRYLTRLNVKQHSHLGPGRGFDPSSQGWDYSYDSPSKSFSYTELPKKTTGEQLSELFEQELQRPAKRRKIS